MTAGWDASGRLSALWGRVGGRDRLAELTGIRPETLSSYNSGGRPLGYANAEKIAAALDVSLVELGAPVTEANGHAVPLLDLLARVSGAGEKTREALERLTQRVEALERAGESRRRGRSSR
jgi:transcriptional regulator with XRE-family HTH domain